MTYSVDITADSLAGLMRQKFSVRMALLYFMEFGRVQLASGSVIRTVRIVDTDPEPYERVKEPEFQEVAE